ncbi:MAG: response regulator [Vulcanimicrobiota bacterium]
MADRLLLVDDDEALLATYRRCLRRTLQVETALGPVEALQKLEQTDYPVVVSDLNMPVMDGLTLLARIRDRWPFTVAIILTGQSDLGLAAEALQDGRVFRFLTKPHPMAELVKAVTGAFEQHRQRKRESA